MTAKTYTIADIAKSAQRTKKTVARYRKQAEDKAGYKFGTTGNDARICYFTETERALILAQMPDKIVDKDSGHNAGHEDSIDAEIVDMPDTYQKTEGSTLLALRSPVLSGTEIQVFDAATAQQNLADVVDYSAKAAIRVDTLLSHHARQYAQESLHRLQAAFAVAEANALGEAAGIMGKPQEPPTAGQ